MLSYCIIDIILNIQVSLCFGHNAFINSDVICNMMKEVTLRRKKNFISLLATILLQLAFPQELLTTEIVVLCRIKEHF